MMNGIKFWKMMNSFHQMNCDYMSYKVLVSTNFQKKFYHLQKNMQSQIRKKLKELEKDPYKKRPNCDIKLLKDTKPKKYRLRIQEYRIIYIIEIKEVKIIDLLKRKIGYDRLEQNLFNRHILLEFCFNL